MHKINIFNKEKHSLTQDNKINNDINTETKNDIKETKMGNTLKNFFSFGNKNSASLKEPPAKDTRFNTFSQTPTDSTNVNVVKKEKSINSKININNNNEIKKTSKLDNLKSKYHDFSDKIKSSVSPKSDKIKSSAPPKAQPAKDSQFIVLTEKVKELKYSIAETETKILDLQNKRVDIKRDIMKSAGNKFPQIPAIIKNIDSLNAELNEYESNIQEERSNGYRAVTGGMWSNLSDDRTGELKEINDTYEKYWSLVTQVDKTSWDGSIKLKFKEFEKSEKELIKSKEELTELKNELEKHKNLLNSI